MRAARFEVVRSDAGWHARFRAANGRIVWWTENYPRRRIAYKAVTSLWFAFPQNPSNAEVREVDER